MNVISLLALLFPILISIGLPVLLYTVWRKKYRLELLPAIVGAIIFFLFALVLESLLHNLLFSRFPILSTNPWVYVVYGCLAAGLFEEVGRALGIWFLGKNQRISTVGTPLSYGIGHGGIEAILLVALPTGQLLFYTIRVWLFGPEALVNSLAGVENTIAATATLLATSPPPELLLSFLASGVERVLAIAVHIALSILVWMVVTKRLPAPYLLLSIGLHALFNVPAAMLQIGLLSNLWLTEGLLAAGALLICLYVFALYRRRGRSKRFIF